MKVLQRITLGLTLVITALVWVHTAEQSDISIKRSEYPEKGVSTVRTYRGKRCILLEMTDKGKKSRSYSVNANVVFSETDEDNDGFFESFMVFDPESQDFEWFSRTTNNTVSPVPSAKLLELKARKAVADQKLQDALRSTRERLAE